MSTAELPGARLDPTHALLLHAIDISTDSAAGGTEAEVTDLGALAGEIASIRAGYPTDSTAEARSERISAQLFLVTQMGQVIHDALLPGNFGAWQVANSAIVSMSLALLNESREVTANGLPLSTEPLDLRNGGLKLLSALVTDAVKVGLLPNLNHPIDAILEGALNVFGRSTIDGDPIFGVGRNWTGSATMSRAEARRAADVDIDLRGNNARLSIDGSATLAIGATLSGSGRAASGEGWIIDGGVIDPGNSAGALTLAGAVRMTSGVMRMEIAGDTAGEFDQLRFADAVKLRGGDIRIRAIDGFEATPGDVVRLFRSDEGDLDFTRMNVKFTGFPDVSVELRPDGTVRFGELGTDGDDELGGGRASELIDGAGGDDTIRGGGGDDHLLGSAGDDRLDGGRGEDELIGGPGRDRLKGGADADVFVFAKAGEPAAPDLILDFTPGQDRIDLAGIDARPGPRGDQAFRWIGDANFGERAGQLRYERGSVAGDLDGDGAADFRIKLAGAPDLGAADFIL